MITEALGLGAQLIGGWGQAKAAKKLARQQGRLANEQFNYTKQLAQPYQEMGEAAMPRFAALLQQQGGEMTQPNRLLTAAHEQNLEGIERNRARTLANTGLMNRFNTSRNRGLTLSANQGAQRAVSDENVQAGLNQQSWRDAATSRYTNTLGNVMNLGRTGTQMLSGGASDYYSTRMGAAGTAAQGEQSWYENLMGASGDYLGGIEAKQESAANRKLYAASKGMEFVNGKWVKS